MDSISDNSSKRISPGIILHRRQPFEQSAGYLPPPPGAISGEYRRIVLNDSTVSACLEFINSTALSRLGEYRHENTEIQDFIRQNLERLSGSFYDLCNDLLSCVWAGFSVAEIVTEVRNNQIWLHSLPILPCETVTFVLDEDTASPFYGSIVEVWQRPYQYAEAHIPAEKCVIMQNHYSGGVAENPYGCSRLDCVYRSIRTKIELVDKWKATLDKYALPLVSWQLTDPNILVRDTDGVDRTAREAAQRQLNEWDDSAKAFVYGAEDNLKLDYPPAGIGDAFRFAIDYHNRMTMRGLLLPSLLLEPGDAGSFALGQEHMRMFQRGEDSLLLNLTESLIEQLIRKLIVWNFGEQNSWGYFEIKRSPEEVMTWGQVYANIKNLGVLDTNSLFDINAIRKQLGFKPLEQAEMDAMKAAKQEEEHQESQGGREHEERLQLPPNVGGVKQIGRYEPK